MNVALLQLVMENADCFYQKGDEAFPAEGFKHPFGLVEILQVVHQMQSPGFQFQWIIDIPAQAISKQIFNTIAHH
jgi:hypothetical protein